MTIRLLSTKFHIPNWREGSISRPRLLEQLSAGLRERRKLALVSAPAGYGKTTLISEWIHSLRAGPGVAWLSLDPADNDPERFLAYLLAAFQRADSAVGEKVGPLLALPQLPPGEMLLDELINVLSEADAAVLLVLEDYHAISNPAIHAGLDYFLDHQPAGVHLVITTRQDPPLPLPRMRARGQMTEIRARDLRFTLEETRLFLGQAMKLDLVEAAAGVLEERTEGWAVGLHLAGLALRNMPDPMRFIETFHGSHRYVLDYLAEEVIRQQGEEMRAFLTQTSVMNRFNAEACRALTGRDDAQAVITRLEQANLFVVPLDDERVWYRYHHLFSDYLQTLLSQAEQIELYKKASAWYEGNDYAVEAVQYALASSDAEFAAGVVERVVNKNTTWSDGNIAQLSSWLDALPAQALRARPQLALNASRLLYLSGRFDLAEQRITQVEEALAAQPATPETEQMLALAALYRGSIASVRGHVEQAIAHTTFAQQRIPRENHLAHARGFFSLGLAYEVADQTERAVDHYLLASDEAAQAGVQFLAVHARCAAAQAQIKQGRLSAAEQTCQAALQMAGGASIPALGLVWIVLGGIALERNDLAGAETMLRDGIALSRSGGLVDDGIVGLAHLGRLHAAKRRRPEAYAALQEASSILRMFNVPRMAAVATVFRACLDLAFGDLPAAEQWAASYQANRAAFADDFADLTLARVLLATGRPDAIPGLLQPLLEKAEAAGRAQARIEGMLLLSLYHRARQELQTALEWLGKSLRLAAPEGYTRIFLDEGDALIDLLPKARAAAPEAVDRLLRIARPDGQTRSTANQQLIEPLSEQEQRVLRLIIAGRSNQEIAEELVISAGTAKWHVHNILQKLGVNNRPQAIARARELGF